MLLFHLENKIDGIKFSKVSWSQSEVSIVIVDSSFVEHSYGRIV